MQEKANIFFIVSWFCLLAGRYELGGAFSMGSNPMAERRCGIARVAHPDTKRSGRHRVRAKIPRHSRSERAARNSRTERADG